MSDDRRLIELLNQYGHLLCPFGEPRTLSKSIEKLTMDDDIVHDAVASYQAMHATAMEPIIAAFYPKRTSAAVKPDGVMGPATKALLETARCACPDYDMALPMEMAGSGNWRGCNGIGDFHCAIVKITTPIPSFLQPHFDLIWSQTVESYAELGLLLRRDDNAVRPQIEVSFVQPSGGWIGLAIVGNGVQCGDTIWAQFDKNYRPASLVSDWTSLLKHEFGHNCGLQHSSGGVMNPYLMTGLPVSWIGDPSHQLLVQRFGGVRVPSANPPSERELVLCWKTGDRFEVVTRYPNQPNTGVWPT